MIWCYRLTPLWSTLLQIVLCEYLKSTQHTEIEQSTVQEEQARAQICAELQESEESSHRVLHLTWLDQAFLRAGVPQAFVDGLSRTAAERRNLTSACVAGFSIAPHLCWHQDLYHCTMKPTRNHSAGSKPNNNNKKLVPLRPWLSAGQPNCCSLNSTLPRGWRRRWRSLLCGRTATCHFPCLMGSSAAGTMDSSPNTDSLALSRAVGKKGRNREERNLGCGECSCWAKKGEIIYQALHLWDLCLETSQALAMSDLVCANQKLLKIGFFPPGYQLMNI